MQTEEYSLTAVETESKTSYCGSELEIGLEEKEQHKEEKSAMLLQRGYEIIRKSYKEQDLMNERKRIWQSHQ